jgi:hypothetical protein
MGQYSKAIITAAGQSLIARAIAGEAQLNITKAKISDYKYPDGTDYKALTDMEGIKQVLDSPETKVLSNDLIQTRVLFSNEEIKATYYIQNIGLYAMDGIKEVLFCIVTAAIPDEMPWYNGVAATSYIYNIQNVVQDAETMHITVSPAGNATIQDVMERVDATGGDISETVIDNLATIDSKYPIPTVGEKVKSFLGKIIIYMKNIKPLEADMTVYVATTGSDITGTGSSTAPYATINYALNQIPKFLNGFTASIVIAAGTYDEGLEITGYSGNLELLLAGNVTITNGVLLTNSEVSCKSEDGSIRTLTAKWFTVLESSRWDSRSTVNIVTTGTYSVGTNNVSLCASVNCLLYMSGIVTMTGNTDIGAYIVSSSQSHFGIITGTGFNIGIFTAAGGKVSCGRNAIIALTENNVVDNGSILVSRYGATIGTLRYDVNLYVATTGSDTTGDGTSPSPYRNIQYAINTLPRDLGGKSVIINIADGSYSERIVINGFCNGRIRLSSSKPAEISSVCNIPDIIITDNATLVDIRGINFTTTTANGIFAVVSNLVIVAYCRCTLASTWSGFSFDQTRFEISGCLIANKGIAVMAHGSDGNSMNWSAGSIGNGVGLHTEHGAVITKVGTQPQGTAMNERSYLGGMIINENGTRISGITAYGLGCTWGTIQGGYYRVGNMIGTAQVIVQVRIVLTTNITAGQTYYVTGFPKVSSGIDISCHTNIGSMTASCYMGASSGTIAFTTNYNIASGQTFAIGTTYITVD